MRSFVGLIIGGVVDERISLIIANLLHLSAVHFGDTNQRVRLFDRQ